IEENIERIKVLTFDGLANQIVNLLPNHEQLFAPDILSQEWERENLYKGVAKSVLLSIHDRDYEMSIKEVLRYLDNRSDRFMDLIVAMLKTRDQWIKKLFKQNILSVQAINSGLKKIIDTHLKKIHTISESILNDRFFSLVSQAIDSEFSSLNHMPSAEIADLNQWRLLAKFCLTGEGQWRKSLDKRTGFPTEIKPQKEEIIEMLNSFHEYEHFREVLSEVKLLPNEEINEADIVILSHISEVLKLSLANLKIELSNTNTTDFIELSMIAEEYLGDEESTSEVSLYLDYKIQHILIDEFQDTSTSQFSLLEKLVSQWSDDQIRSLFLVGDPMQSIYRFRESRVELFLHAKMQGIANLKLIPITLETNFRSNRSIVEKNNEIFQQIFPQENDESLGSIAYTPSVSAEIDNGEGFMNFHSFAISDEHAESQSIIKLIEQSLNDKEKKSIGILVRTRKQLRPIVELLEARGINFSGIKTKFLKDHLFTRDLLILARCLLDKSDKLAWLSLLRSP
ncbi:MAG: DNA helicase UvrD, partial [Gammaproteobacteria bacterium]|nr:DNA helicase UvrD [Gammaproteobacteria bacterium]